MDRLLPVALLAAVISGYACGGGEATGPEEGPPDQTQEPAELDFSPIEGSWTGTATEPGGQVFEIRATLESGANRGRQVGGVRYFLASAPDQTCLGAWLAESVDLPDFTVRELITGGEVYCPDGIVELRLDEDTGALRYSFTPTEQPGFPASGTLTRSD